MRRSRRWRRPAIRSMRCRSGRRSPPTTGLLASRYMHEHGCTEADFAELAALMRRNAVRHPGRALPRADHARRRARLAADRHAAEDARLLPRVRRWLCSGDRTRAGRAAAGRRSVRRRRPTTSSTSAPRPTSARFGAGKLDGPRARGRGPYAGGRRIRRDLRQLHRHAGAAARGDRPGPARRLQAGSPARGTSNSAARCRSTRTAACCPMATAAWRVRWRIWPRPTCR